jgi:hypothetical protein
MPMRTPKDFPWPQALKKATRTGGTLTEPEIARRSRSAKVHETDGQWFCG